MRLSLMKAAHVALFGTAYRKYGYLPGFGEWIRGCRSSTSRHQRPEAHCSSDRAESRVEVRGIPHLPKPGNMGTHRSLPVDRSRSVRNPG